VDQPDFVTAGGTTGFEVPAGIRSDQFIDRGVRLPYFKFPHKPHAVVQRRPYPMIGQPNQAAKGFACHSLHGAHEQNVQASGLEDGVSSESCHGPASGRLGPHTTAKWPHERSLALGMYDTRD
jgi:hypothetical protein